MCDPVTMAAVSAGMSSAGGYFAGSSTGWIASMGTGMINTASLFNYSSAVGGGGLAAGGGMGMDFFSSGNAMGAIRNIGQIGSIVNNNLGSIGMGLSIFSNANETSANLRAAEYDKQRLELQEKRYREKAEDEKLAARRKQNDRTMAYIESLSSMNTAMGASGMEIDSASYEAMIASSRRKYKEDQARLRGMGLSKVLNNLFEAQDKVIGQRAIDATKKSTLSKGILKGFRETTSVYKEVESFKTAQVSMDSLLKRGV
tara:strand:+ start:1600 stop:2373 length:774 start_codon:yes stop_codon:yes gene_type:complete